MMNLSVILCTYNRANQLDTALRSLESVEVPAGLSWELIVVDNNSIDDTKAVIEAARQREALPCKYVFEPRQGKSYALNTGISRAAGDIVAFTDDDVTFDRRWLDALWKAFDDQQCMGMGGRIVPIWTSPRPRWFSETGRYSLMTAIIRFELGNEIKPLRRLQPPWGANMAFRRVAFTRYGGFDPRFGPNGHALMRGEDVLFGRCLLDAGERLLYVPDAIVYHPVEPERLQKRYFVRYYYHHGRMQIRMQPVPSGAIRWFGVPRYMVHALLTNAAQWAVAFGEQRRFYYWLNCALLVGQIREAYGARIASNPRLADRRSGNN